ARAPGARRRGGRADARVGAEVPRGSAHRPRRRPPAARGRGAGGPLAAFMADAVVRHVVTFGRVLREAGLEVGPGRIADALTALDEVELGRQDDVYWSLRTTMVTRFEEIEPFDLAFNAWFLRAPVLPSARIRTARLPRAATTGRADAVRGGERDEHG